ncbi:MAG: hypothetical protein QOI42_362 [Frankiaceae bacterium]|jgi:hypothetical protein|nr:hypothetical protein [Frankiaceae bacterium]
MMVRRTALVLSATCASLAAAALVAAPAVAVSPARGCPPTFAPTDLASYLALPQHQAGLLAGTYTVASLSDLFAVIDNNGDGFICFKPFVGGSQEAFHVKLIDDASNSQPSASE